MSRFCGNVGFVVTKETTPGVWTEEITVKKYYGDVYRLRSRRNVNSNQLNDDLTISNEIHITADPFATNNFSSIRYVEFMGVKWKVDNVSVERPKLILTLGGVYNGQ